MAQKVIVAMSGGVDSSLTAALLLEAGYDVIGVHMRLHDLHAGRAPRPARGGRLNHGCCSVEDVDDARMVAYELGIPFYVLNFEPEFRRHIIGNFIQEYSRGRTPYPCLNCNRYVKFDALLERAVALGADYIATGHYARIARTTPGATTCAAPRTAARTRPMSSTTWSRTRWPACCCRWASLTSRRCAAWPPSASWWWPTSPTARRSASSPTTTTATSWSRCSRASAQPGPMVNTRGEVVGRHTGLPHYTVGQRKGLGALGLEPHFVLRIDPATQHVAGRHGRRTARAYSLTADDVHFVAGRAPHGAVPGAGQDPLSRARGARAGHPAGRRARARRLRHPAAGHHPRPGRRLLRGRRGAGRRHHREPGSGGARARPRRRPPA